MHEKQKTINGSETETIPGRRLLHLRATLFNFVRELFYDDGDEDESPTERVLVPG